MQNMFSSDEKAEARELDVDSAMRNALSAAGGRASFTRAHDIRSSVRRARPRPDAAPAPGSCPAESNALRRKRTSRFNREYA
ncbi:hypothetical protein L3V59_25990 [Burkholderia aenigmatica]|uniref:hypothetical protein n=1 Tax=Burkholderia aenigmatica TaxID=2015348 RepID=UPI001F2FAEF7|nr:hypothetical protein [Burkholderia aenigmatica]UKD16578.1 hypothetical protein L3V59_25990 [Burkholderia aenigmatica]